MQFLRACLARALLGTVCTEFYYSHRVHACTMSSHLVTIGTVLKSTCEEAGLVPASSEAAARTPSPLFPPRLTCTSCSPASCALCLFLSLALELLLSCALRLLLGLALRLLLGLSLRLLISLALCFLPRARGQLRAGLRHRCAPLSRFSLANKISDGSAAPRLDSRSPPRTDELSDPQARTQARKLHTENRIRFACSKC